MSTIGDTKSNSGALHALCENCIHFTTDYKFHDTSIPIPLNGRLAHRLSYTNEARYFFLLRWEVQDFLPNLPRLKASSLAGCPLCGVIRTKLLAGRQPKRVMRSEITIRAEYGFEDFRPRKPTGVIFEYQVVGGVTHWQRYHEAPTFVLAASRENPASRQFRWTRSLDPLSLESQATIKGWINECKSSHQYCKMPSHQTLPTRLIDVQPSNPRLVFTAGQTGTYATLSYCWGLSPSNPLASMYTTTLATLSSRMSEMLFTDIPKTLQDAIHVTRALGLKYLWIDALCIIQDSPADVAHEIGTMHAVYGNCEIAISATSSTSSKSGFLSPRQDVQPLVTVPFVPSEGGKVGEYGFYDTATFPARNNWQAVENAEWNTRAWTFQERILPPRVLHFGTETIRLECRTSDFSELECLPREIVMGNSYMGNDYSYLGILERIAAQEEPRDMTELYETYYKFASQYSRRTLSFETDRVAAFSAVVTGFKQLTQSENLLGLWIDDIWRSLIWSVLERRKGSATSSTPLNPTTTPSPWRSLISSVLHRRKGSATSSTPLNPTTPITPTTPPSPWPSWSWFSNPNPISWIDSSTMWKRANPSSLLPQGTNTPVLLSRPAPGTLPRSLTISAVLRTAEMEIDTETSTVFMRHQGERWGQLEMDAKFEIADYQEALWSAKSARSSPPPPPPPPLVGRTLWLLQLRNKHQIFNDDGGGTMCSAAGLALEPVNAAGGGEYRRIGIFSVNTRDKWEALFEGREQTVVTLI
ncbi:hypothetical protein VE03_03084 [Pseudogymnoascus sp. 23342-1-I1]|nr:hypothetical protein VE03_03084 [Pseudogymnoascus sp. 23342-1-I1]